MGRPEISDLDETEANKQLVTRFVTEILVAGDFARLPDFVAPDLAEHNPERRRRHRRRCRPSPPKRAMRYVELHKVVGAGELRGRRSPRASSTGSGMPSSTCSALKRDTIVEHWDVIEEITPEDTWVNVGKF